MYSLVFENAYGKFETIGTSDNIRELINMIAPDIKKRNPDFKIFYYRTWAASDHTIKIDVGSYAEFYYIDTGNKSAKEAWSEYNDEYKNEYK